MRKLLMALAMGSLLTAVPAAANHPFNQNVPFSSRGECESEMAALSNGDRERLLELFPNLYSSSGEVRSVLTRAWACELNEEDGQWYITDHRLETLTSDWWQRRLAGPRH